MICTYILQSDSDGQRYIGSTNNLERRLSQHARGQVRPTKFRLPVRLVGYRVCETIVEAAYWERKYKRSHGQLERDVKRGLITIVGA